MVEPSQKLWAVGTLSFCDFQSTFAIHYALRTTLRAPYFQYAYLRISRCVCSRLPYFKSPLSVRNLSTYTYFFAYFPVQDCTMDPIGSRISNTSKAPSREWQSVTQIIPPRHWDIWPHPNHIHITQWNILVSRFDHVMRKPRWLFPRVGWSAEKTLKGR